LCRQLFEAIVQRPFPKVRPRWLVSSKGKRLELDGYCAGLKMAFEYNGEQHDRADHFFNMNGGFSRREQCDLEKQKLCALRRIKLVIVPQFPRLGDVEDCERRVRHAITIAP
jgi:hypothetical protein